MQPSQKTVYLAEVSDDLQEEHDGLRDELERRGVRILPDTALPFSGEELVDKVRHEMQQAEVSVHLIGRYYGRRPAGDKRSVPHIQYDVASEFRNSKDGPPSLSMLTWIPDDFEPSTVGGSHGQFLQSLLNDYDTATRPVEVFYSYAHEDEEFVNALRSAVAPMERRGLISCWHNREIIPGDEWDEKIIESLESARLILFLVSSDFMACDAIFDKEIKRAMELHESGEARIIPIILRPTSWEDAPFSKLQPLPKDGLPITKWKDRDDAYVEIAKGLRAVAEELQAGDAEAALSPNGGDVLSCNFEKFKEVVQGRFPTSSPPSDSSPAVYVSGGPDEYLASDSARELCDWLRRQNFGVVESCTEGDIEDQMAHEKANIAYSDAFLIYAGDGPVSWVQPKALLANSLSKRREKPVVAAVYNKRKRQLGISLPGIDILDACDCDTQAAMASFVNRIRSQYVV